MTIKVGDLVWVKDSALTHTRNGHPAHDSNRVWCRDHGRLWRITDILRRPVAEDKYHATPFHTGPGDAVPAFFYDYEIEPYTGQLEEQADGHQGR